LALVLDDKRSRLTHTPSVPRRQSQVPVGVTSVLGRTVHQRPSLRQTFDCGFSPVVWERVNGVSGMIVSWAGTSAGAARATITSTRTTSAAGPIEGESTGAHRRGVACSSAKLGSRRL
jgi:hypothetical protein